MPVGGFVIFDDIRSHPAVQHAWDDFKQAQQISERLTPIDGHSAYFMKTADIRVDQSRRKPPQDINIGLSVTEMPVAKQETSAGRLGDVSRARPSVRCMGSACFKREEELMHLNQPGVQDPPLTRRTAAMAVIQQRYSVAIAQRSDINEHLPTLRQYATRVTSIVEMGVRGVVSSWAFLLGLAESTGHDRSLLGVDLEPCEYTELIARGEALGMQVAFRQGNSAVIQLPPRDLLFIDTWHVYAHLQAELRAHHATTRRYIIMHDTTVDGEVGESVRLGWDTAHQARASGYARADIERGLRPAIDEFLHEHGNEWLLERVDTNNNGLTVLARRSGGLTTGKVTE